jgi:hypothetical protein
MARGRSVSSSMRSVCARGISRPRGNCDVPIMKWQRRLSKHIEEQDTEIVRASRIRQPLSNYFSDPYRACPYTEDSSPARQMSCSKCMNNVCRRFGELRINVVGNPLPEWDRPACRAGRNGQRCTEKALPGRRRCRLHRGLSTGPKTEARRQRIAEAQRRRWAVQRGGVE